MSNQENFLQKVREFGEKMQPVLEKCGDIAYQIWMTLRMIGSYIFKLRSVFMAVPVGVAAVILAMKNMRDLPEQVGIVLLESGAFEVMVPRMVAVFGPMAITALCLLMMFLSKKTLYPWVISIFSLVIPVLLLFINQYPT